ncbi:tetratricopeptide (TPR) repeat protein [Mucilaginibacter sp. UYP25]|uniref:tetratricopeptide repeat protein n=1 Tax=unclassified Mucilaginibacter TaxID=2617802 RepID=UPI0033980E53
MKKLAGVFVLSFPFLVLAQNNCSVYKDAAHKKACELYNRAIEASQGSKTSQIIFLNSIEACPSFAPSLNEMSVPYLKRGDFSTWKVLMDQAVKADPQYLSTRGWCLFKFLRDYKNSFQDLKRAYDINSGIPGYSGDGDYDLRIVMALNQREMGNYNLAIKYFNECIQDNEKKKVVGLFDYLHRGVTEYKCKNYQAALNDLLLETKKYEKLADTYYYLGLTYFKLKLNRKGKQNLLKAKELYLHSGYYRNDPYCEALDQVYLSDINKAIRSLK